MLKNISRAKNFAVRKLFPLFERYLGIHVTPADYFSPIPTTYQLGPEVFTKQFSGAALKWNNARQLQTLSLAASYVREYKPTENSGLSLVDAMLLYAMVRHKKPKLMVEIGSGDTTEIALQALRKNREEGNSFTFIAIEPFPSAKLLKIQDPNFKLIIKNLQDVELSLFAEADILFIDSTHVSRIDSDVNYEIFEIVPSLRAGALIHWHDIPLPQNYWKDWIQNGNQFWNEAYVLQAFLMYNEAYSIIWASNFLRLHYLSSLKSAFPFFQDDHRISSFWIEKNSTSQDS